MSPLHIGIICICAFILLAAFRLPIAFSFAVAGFSGIGFIRGWGPALRILGNAPFSFASQEILIALPLFVLMGNFAFQSGISADLFSAANKWLGRLPGGLAQAATLACTGFAACTGDSVGAAATMGTIAYPSMERHGYDKGLTSACIAVGGTLGILIPPSIPFIVYGYLARVSVADLFIAGIAPGLLLCLLLLIIIYITCKRKPYLGPPGVAFSLREKFKSLKGVGGMLILFVLIIGGLYTGIFAPSEAGAIGASGAFIISLTRRRVNLTTLKDSLGSSLQITCFVFTIIIGAMIFNTLLSISGLSAILTGWIASMTVSPYFVLLIVLLVYLVLGMFMDPLAMTLLTVPTFVPIMVKIGFNPIWFGVIYVIMSEIAMITPPVGVNVYVIQGVTKVPLEVIFRSIFPFLIAMVACVILLIIFPQICLFLPNLNK
jgi:tripartite ATP-independent transporter DctM subunit